MGRITLPSVQQSKGESMELLRYLQIVRKWAWLMLLGSLVAGGAAWAVSTHMPPVYRAETSVVVRVTNVSAGEQRTAQLIESVTATFREVLATDAVIERAATNLALPAAETDGWTSKVTVWVVPDSAMIRLAVEDVDPGRAWQLANELVSVFLQMQQESVALQGAEVSVVAPAALPVEAVGPDIWFNVLVAALGGCGLGAGMALLLEYRNAARRTSEDEPA